MILYNAILGAVYSPLLRGAIAHIPPPSAEPPSKVMVLSKRPSAALTRIAQAESPGGEDVAAFGKKHCTFEGSLATRPPRHRPQHIHHVTSIFPFLSASAISIVFLALEYSWPEARGVKSRKLSPSTLRSPQITSLRSSSEFEPLTQA